MRKICVSLKFRLKPLISNVTIGKDIVYKGGVYLPLINIKRVLSYMMGNRRNERKDAS